MTAPLCQEVARPAYRSAASDLVQRVCWLRPVNTRSSGSLTVVYMDPQTQYAQEVAQLCIIFMLLLVLCLCFQGSLSEHGPKPTSDTQTFGALTNLGNPPPPPALPSSHF